MDTEFCLLPRRHDENIHCSFEAFNDSIPAPRRCELCGALLEQTERTVLEKTTLEDGLWALADVAERIGPVAISVLLLRLRYPRVSSREIARRLNLSAIQNYRLYLRVLRSDSRLARIMRGMGAKTRGLQGGRKRGAGPSPKTVAPERAALETLEAVRSPSAVPPEPSAGPLATQ